MSSEEVKQQVINKLYEHNISERELAQSIYLSPQALHYCLHNSTTLDVTIYNNIQSFFKQRGIMVNKTDEKVSNLSIITVEFNALTAQTIEVLGGLMKMAIDGKNLNELDKTRLLEQMDNYENDINAKFKSIKDMLNNG